VKPLSTPLWRVFALLTLLGLALLANFGESAERAFRTQEALTPIDFPVFYIGGKVALQRAATPLYYPPADRSKAYTLLSGYADDATPWAQMARANGFPHISPFTNPPFSALVMAPLAELPWQYAYIVWLLLIIALAAGATFLGLQLVPSARGLETFAPIFIAVCFFFPFSSNLTLGQANVTILFVWTLGVYFLSRRKSAASGICFALGTVLKVSPAVVVPFLVLRRQWRWLAAYAVGVLVLTGFSVWVLGWQTHVIWLTKIFPAISSGLGNGDNRSLAGLIDVLCGPPYVDTLYATTQWPIPPRLVLFEKACSLVIVVGFLGWCWRTRKDSQGAVNDLILLPLISLLVAPFSWQPHFVLAILPLAYLWAKAREATFGELVALYLSTLALGTDLPMYLAAYSPWAGPHLVMLAIALWPAATCAILCVGMRMYARESHAEQPRESLAEAAMDKGIPADYRPR